MRTLLVVATLLVSATANAAAGEVIVGGGLAFGTDIATPGLQLNGYYAFDRQSKLSNLRLGLDIDVFLSNTDDVPPQYKLSQSWADFNTNAQYVFLAPKDRPFLFYGLAGLNFAFVGAKTEYYDGINQRDIDANAFKLGVNLGVGGEYGVDVGERNGADFAFFGEAKYVVSDADQFVFTAGVRVALPIGGGDPPSAAPLVTSVTSASDSGG